MSLHTQPTESVPAETARVARAAFPGGNPYLALRDELGTIFADDDFAGSTRGEGAGRALAARLGHRPPVRRGVVGSPCRRRRAGPDRLEVCPRPVRLDDPGFDASVLCEFRRRLLDGSAEQRLLEVLLDRCRERGRLKVRGRQRTDSTHVLARIRASTGWNA